MSDQQLTREGLIWKLAQAISRAEGKAIDPGMGAKPAVSREYALTLVCAVADAVDGKGGNFTYNGL